MSLPSDHPPDSAAAVASPEETLRALARPVLEARAPVLLVREDGAVLVANAAAGLGTPTRLPPDLPPDLARRIARIAATLRPGRPPRLERLRLPGQMSASLVACSLLSVPGARAVLIAPPGAPAAASSSPAAPVAAPPIAAQTRPPTAAPSAAAGMPTAATAAEGTAPEHAMPVSTSPAGRERWFWQTEAAGRFRAVDPRLAAALGRDAGSLVGSDWAALGAPGAHEAVCAGKSFSRVEIRLETVAGRLLVLEIGGAPVRGDGMRGFALLRGGAAAETEAEANAARIEAAGEPQRAAEPAAIPTLVPGIPRAAGASEVETPGTGPAMTMEPEHAEAQAPAGHATAPEPGMPAGGETSGDAEALDEAGAVREPDAPAERDATAEPGTVPEQATQAEPSAPAAAEPQAAAESAPPSEPDAAMKTAATAEETAPAPPSEPDAAMEPAATAGEIEPVTAGEIELAASAEPGTPAPVATEAAASPAEPAPVRVMLSIVPSSPNVVPLRAGPDTPGEAARASWAGLSAGERNAFREIARALGARLEGVDDTTFPEPQAPTPPRSAQPASVVQMKPAEPVPPMAQEPAPEQSGAAPSAADLVDAALPSAPEAEGFRRLLGEAERPILDRLPLGVVVYRGDKLLYANRALLDWSGYADIAALEAAGGLTGLFGESGGADEADGARALTMIKAGGEQIPVEARLMSAPWDGGTAMLYVLRRAGSGFDQRLRSAELALREAESTARELRAILDTATDGVVLIDKDGIILSMNRSAEALFGFESGEIQGESFTMLFAPESRRGAVDYLDGLASNGVASVLNDGREVIGRVREGGLIPLFMTIGRVGQEVGEAAGKFCAVLRDITQWKRAEEELTEAKRLAERANLAKSDFLAKISHEIRTPLNAIIGFSEVMMEERFGPIENERYRDYLRDIHASGGHLISLINDLLDLSKIEAGKLDLAFTSVALNEIVQQCMAIMQPQANRERIIIRSSLAADLPPVVADARSMRQIVLNLVSNSIKFSRPGGQVILSTALTEAGEVVLRVRDTGIGMSESDIATAMEPFRQLATSGRTGSGGTGLGLPLTKALAEANRASFSIRSAVDAGTLVEITFPSTRVLAE